MTLLSYGMWLGATSGVLSCVAYTIAAVAQRRLAIRLSEPLTGGRRRGLLLRHPLWWVSPVFNGGRAGYQAASPRSPWLQPLGVLVLVFGMPWTARLEHRRVSSAQ